MMRRMLLVAPILLAALGFTLARPADSTAQAPASLQIGMVKTFFHGVPDYLVKIVTDPFGGMMKKATGLGGKLDVNDGMNEVAAKLDSGKLQLGVFHGHELAWAQQKHPKLKPLMLAVNEHREVCAYVVVRQDHPAKSLADLRGKLFDVPERCKEHCRLFLERNCTDNNGCCELKKYFGKVHASKDEYEALDNVAKRQCEAVIVDTIVLEFYKSVKKAVYEKNLRILARSEPAFPAAVIAYKEGAIEPATLKKLTDGLLRAHEINDCRDLMGMWNIAAFEPIPKDYQNRLDTIRKTYPMAESTKVSMR